MCRAIAFSVCLLVCCPQTSCCLAPLCTRVPLSDIVHVSVRQSLRRVGVNLGSLSRCRIRASMAVRAAHPCTCCRTPVCTKRQKTRWSRSPLEYSVRARLPSVVVLSLTSRSVWSHAYMHAHMCTHTRTCTHAPTHSTHTHTHTHTHGFASTTAMLMGSYLTVAVAEIIVFCPCAAALILSPHRLP